ncbi:MAG: dockerin type I domain-containing protein [Methanosarcinaceae archaeon]
MKMKMLCLTIIAIITLCMFAQSVSAAPVVSVEPSYLNVMQGDVFIVNITLDPTGVEIMGAQYELHFNNTLFNATKQTQGTFLSHDGAGTNVFANRINNTIGVIEYGETRVGVDYGVTNPGIIATITFRALVPGTSSFDLNKVKLSDPFAQQITGILINNGTVEINEIPIFLISGFVVYDNGDPALNPDVMLTNLNTGEIFTAETNVSSNYHQVSTDITHISSNDVLCFNTTDNLGNTTVFDHSITPDEINAGGFLQNVTLYIPDIIPPVITNISIISKTKDSATIAWETDEVSDSLVKFGTEPGNCTEIVYNAMNVTYHNIDIGGLISNTTYYYVVNSTDLNTNSAQGEECNFTTFAEIIIEIDDSGALSGENVTVPIIIRSVPNVGIADILITYNQSIVHVTEVCDSDFDYMDSLIDNLVGTTRIGAFQTSPGGLSGDVKIANITLMAVGNPGNSCVLNISINELKEATNEEITIPASTHNATFSIGEATPPLVTNPEATPLCIPEDTNFDPGWGETSILNITVMDECGVANVTIDLSGINCLTGQPMSRIPGTDIWTVTVNAPVATALLYNETYLPHNFTVRAVDIFGNVNTSVDIPLIIMKNGDVSENGEVTLYDAMYLARYIMGKPEFESIYENIGEVSGNSAVTLYDAMYLGKHVMAESGFDVLC